MYVYVCVYVSVYAPPKLQLCWQEEQEGEMRKDPAQMQQVMCLCLCLCLCLFLCLCLCICVCVCVCTYIHTYTYTYTYIYIRIRTHTHTQLRELFIEKCKSYYGVPYHKKYHGLEGGELNSNQLSSNHDHRRLISGLNHK